MARRCGKLFEVVGKTWGASLLKGDVGSYLRKWVNGEKLGSGKLGQLFKDSYKRRSALTRKEPTTNESTTMNHFCKARVNLSVSKKMRRAR